MSVIRPTQSKRAFTNEVQVDFNEQLWYQDLATNMELGRPVPNVLDYVHYPAPTHVPLHPSVC